MSKRSRPAVGVVIATKGRPVVAGALVERLRRQTLQPASIVVVATDPANLPSVSGPGVSLVLKDRTDPGVRRNRGHIVRAQALRSVRVGLQRGRVAGMRLGFSQVSNVPGLMRKGMAPLGLGLSLIGRNFVGARATEPHIDPHGGLLGNLLGGAKVLAGRLTPERAEVL